MNVESSKQGSVGILTINNPKKRNALTGQLAFQFLRELNGLQSEPAVSAIVIRGEGGNFCSGADRALLEGARRNPGDQSILEELESIYECFRAVAECQLPTVAAIRGHAVGAGVNLALACDLRLVSQDARFASGFLQIGLHPGGGHFLLLESAVGAQTAVAMTIFGQQLQGVEMVERGLAWQSLPDSEVETQALAIASRLNDGELVRTVMSTFRQQSISRHLPYQVAIRAEQAGQIWSLTRSGVVE